MKPLATTPVELESQLASIFPAFAVKLELDEEYPATYHSVLLFHFNSFFSKNVETCAPKQLKAFAELVTRCSAVPGDLKNAFATCFLEHAKQMSVNKHLGNYLREAERAGAR
jgi:hypothetical protein